MRRSICCGTFMGGEIEPGTFHEQVTRDPKDEDVDPSTGESNGPDTADSFPVHARTCMEAARRFERAQPDHARHHEE